MQRPRAFIELSAFASTSFKMLLIAHLARSMAGEDSPLATLEDGVRSAVSCLGVDEALDTGRVVDLRPFWRQAGIVP